MKPFTPSSGKTHSGGVKSQILAQATTAAEFMLRLISITPQGAFIDRSGVYFRPAFCPVYARLQAQAQRPTLQR